MAKVHGANQSPIVTQRYLNTASYAGDPAPGVLVSTAQVSGSLVSSYGGMVGGILTLAEGGAAAYSDPASSQLYGGDYQYVQFDPASSAAAAVQGQVVFWTDPVGTSNLESGNFKVTPDYANPQGPVAGIALSNTARGNYWFIQVAGIAEVKFKTGVLNNFSPQVGDLVYVDSTNSPYADTAAAGVSVTAGILKDVLGRVWAKVPAVGAISPVMLGLGPGYFPGA